jgi:hypothetical protein
MEDVVAHVRCELAMIVDAASVDPVTDPGVKAATLSAANPRLQARLKADPDLKNKLVLLIDDHFVATVQLSLEVTDNEGLNGSLSYIRPWAGMTNFTGTLGGQLTGTQDRSVTIAYSVDLANLRGEYTARDCLDRDWFWKDVGFTGGLDRDLGLADIIADGLMALDTSAKDNIYSSAGLALPTAPTAVELSGYINKSASPTVAFTGKVIFVAPAPGASAADTVTMTGRATITSDTGAAGPYIVNLTGSTVQATRSDGADKLAFVLTGNFVAESNVGDVKIGSKPLGFNPAVSLLGWIDKTYGARSLELNGIITPATFQATPLPLSLKPGHTDRLTALMLQPFTTQSLAATAGSAGGGARSSASTTSGSAGTSFGTLVDFTLVYGLNLGPNWTLTNFKGPGGGGGSGSSGSSSGGGQPVSASRTNLDSMSITFTPTCQNSAGQPPYTTFWQSIPICNIYDPAQRQNAVNQGTQNNLLMLFRSEGIGALKQP